ncbi:MAG TPA: AMP-binding protein, partial [Streptosporangiaceae bacterium]|nr:AMP-binding protein [Streptosporangiaceae bacterium]
MTEYVLEERAAVLREASGRTVCDLLRLAADRWADEPAYSDRAARDQPWQTITWGQTRDRVLRLAAGFLALGLEPGERVALMMPNRLEHVLADQAALHAGGV